MSSKTYIHYGSDAFDMERFEAWRSRPPHIGGLNKPPYGLWACDVDSLFGWKEWCESEEWHTDRLDKSFTFTLSDSARILTVTKDEDVKDYITDFDTRISLLKCLDFEKIMKEYDGMELIHGDNWCQLHDGLFYTWDVDSIVVWNPQVLQFA